MGCVQGGGTKNPEQERNNNVATNDDEPDEKTYKLLLLGAGGSGKSTVFRQVKILYGEGYDEDERLTLAVTIHQNMVQSIKKIVDQCPKYGPVPAEHQQLVEAISKLPDDGPYKNIQDAG